MIFREELAKLIMEGKKTQTRRPVKEGTDVIYDFGEEGVTGEVAEIRDSTYNTVRFGVGREVAVQPERGKAIGRIKILSIQREYLRDISEEDVRAEGFAGRGEFFKTWREIYGKWADTRVEVWVVSFEVVK